MQSRDSHLAGKRHSEAESKSMLQAGISGEASLRRTCSICNIEVPTHERNSHLVSRRHTEACRLPNNATTASFSTTSKFRPANYEIDESTKAKTLNVTELIEVAAWQCTMCAFNVPLSERQSHLYSLDHLQNVLEMLKISCMAFKEPENKLTAKEITKYQVNWSKNSSPMLTWMTRKWSRKLNHSPHTSKVGFPT